MKLKSLFEEINKVIIIIIIIVIIIKKPTLGENKVLSLKVSNVSFLSSGRRKAWSKESQRRPRKRTTVERPLRSPDANKIIGLYK